MNSAENLGEVLRGDRIENSVYTVSTITLHCVLCGCKGYDTITV